MYRQLVSSGPILIFDKSAVEAFSVDECVWLSQFFRVNITPMFFVETIADLEKQVRGNRDAEEVVARLALKTSAMTADANVHYARLCAADLMGNAIDMHRVPVIMGGRTVERSGRKGLVFDVSDEDRLLARWQRREFQEEDRIRARAWRQALGELDLRSLYQSQRAMLERMGKPKDEAAVKALVDSVLADPALAEMMVSVALSLLNVPHEMYGPIYDRWISLNRPTLPLFAPYAAHCLSVHLFAAFAIGADLISWERASNMADLAYLFYLPFCMIFTSGDKLHLRTAPLFMHDDQNLVAATELKNDLARLDAYYSNLPEDVRMQGVMKFAQRPPTEGDFLVARLWDGAYTRHWREQQQRTSMTSAAEKGLVDEMRRISEEPRRDGATVTLEDAAFVMMQHEIPIRMGKWRIAPLGAEAKGKQ